MKLLSVNMTLDPGSGGGSATRTRQVARVLAGLGVTSTVATSDEGIDGLRAGLDGVALVTLPVTAGRFRLPIGRFDALRDAVRHADIVLLVNHWTAINVLAWRAITRFNTPYIVCPAGALPIDGGRSRGLKRVYNALAGRAIVAGADAHIAVTADEASQFAPYGVIPSAVTVIPNGMPDLPPGDGGRFRARHGLGNAPLLLFMGRLAPIKGPDLLVGALARSGSAIADWHLVLAGPDDGMRATLEAQVARLGLAQRVHFTGFLDEAGKADALAASALVVVPSRREAMSIVVLEAASAGRAVLVTDQCGIPDVAMSGGGWVVEASEEAIAAGLIEATVDRAGLAHRGVAWQRAASARYSWATIGRTYLDLFTSVLERRRR